jgi:hypothetical protein
MLRIFKPVKIQRLRPGLNPQTWVPEASMLTTRPPKPSTPGKGPVPIVPDAGWASEPVWTGANNLAPTRIRTPDHPARRQSLYQLHYSAHSNLRNIPEKWSSHSHCGGNLKSSIILNDVEELMGLSTSNMPVLVSYVAWLTCTSSLVKRTTGTATLEDCYTTNT